MARTIVITDVTTRFNFVPTREGWLIIWLRRVFRPVNLTEFYYFFTPQSLWTMTRKHHRQKFLTPLKRFQKQNSHPAIVWNSAASVLLFGQSRFHLRTASHAKRGWSVSPVPTGTATRQSERTFSSQNIFCLHQWLSPKRGSSSKTAIRPEKKTNA